MHRELRKVSSDRPIDQSDRYVPSSARQIHKRLQINKIQGRHCKVLIAGGETRQKSLLGADPVPPGQVHVTQFTGGCALLTEISQMIVYFAVRGIARPC